MRSNAKAYVLQESHFMIALAGAAILHLAALFGWMAMPRAPVMEIPVRILNIKLGESGGEEVNVDQSIRPSPQAANTNVVEQEINRFFQAPAPLKPLPPSKLPPAPVKAAPLPPAPIIPAAPPPPRPQAAAPAKSKSQQAVEQASAQQYVRDQPFQYKIIGGALPQNGGTPLGNSTAPSAEVAARYEQLISTWIERFKNYPMEARSQGLRGVPVVRVRIDRRGNVRYVALDKSTGFQVLDRAAVDMITNANPLPPAPPEYKSGQDLLEFTIPVRFNL